MVDLISRLACDPPTVEGLCWRRMICSVALRIDTNILAGPTGILNEVCYTSNLVLLRTRRRRAVYTGAVLQEQVKGINDMLLDLMEKRMENAGI